MRKVRLDGCAEPYEAADSEMDSESPYLPFLSYIATKRYYLRQEPGALVAHAGICAGGCRVTGVSTATTRKSPKPICYWAAQLLPVVEDFFQKEKDC